MAFLGFRVPPETVRLYKQFDVPGEQEDASEFHITLLYMGKNTPIEQVVGAAEVIYEITSRTKHFMVRTTRLTSFPPFDDGHPIIAPVESDALRAFRKELADAFDKNGIEFSKKHPDYKPHVTLAYAEEALEERTTPTIEWGAHEVVLWGGDHGEDRLTMTFPLSVQDLTERVASTHSLRAWFQDLRETQDSRV